MNLAFVYAASALYRAFCTVFHPVKIEGGTLSKDGAFILCANHVSMQDPMLLVSYLPRRIHFMAKKELFDNRLLRPFMRMLGSFPVSRGERDLSAVRESLEILKSGGVLGVFPEGHRYHDGQIHELEGGLALIAIRSGAPVVPAYIRGDYKLFRRMTVVLGAPVDLGDIGARPDSRSIREATARISASFRTLAADKC